ncbi:MAG: Uma2 family endonuclease [Chloroflexi bacterium]|nr:Uma2 family endonuclease [Chloroflexota bacterium]
MTLEADLLRRDQPFTLRQPRPDLTDDAAFLTVCRAHPDLRIETDLEGTLIVMSPTGWRSSNRNARITAQLLIWAEHDGTGQVSDSLGLYHLRGHARRAPDAAWIRSDRLAEVPSAEQERILPIAPDFVIELRSPSDRLEDLLAKMREYADSGVRLGWLIDPIERRCYEVRPGRDVISRGEPPELSGDPELPGFRLDLRRIW